MFPNRFMLTPLPLIYLLLDISIFSVLVIQFSGYKQKQRLGSYKPSFEWLANCNIYVAELFEIIWLKCANRHRKGDLGSTRASDGNPGSLSGKLPMRTT